MQLKQIRELVNRVIAQGSAQFQVSCLVPSYRSISLNSVSLKQMEPVWWMTA